MLLRPARQHASSQRRRTLGTSLLASGSDSAQILPSYCSDLDGELIFTLHCGQCLCPVCLGGLIGRVHAATAILIAWLAGSFVIDRRVPHHDSSQVFVLDCLGQSLDGATCCTATCPNQDLVGRNGRSDGEPRVLRFRICIVSHIVE